MNVHMSACATVCVPPLSSAGTTIIDSQGFAIRSYLSEQDLTGGLELGPGLDLGWAGLVLLHYPHYLRFLVHHHDRWPEDEVVEVRYSAVLSRTDQLGMGKAGCSGLQNQSVSRRFVSCRRGTGDRTHHVECVEGSDAVGEGSGSTLAEGRQDHRVVDRDWGQGLADPSVG